MAEYRIRETGQVMLENELRQWARALNGTTWVQTTEEILESLGVDPVFEGPQATTIPPYQYSMRQGIEQIEGKWYTKYVAGPIFSDDPDGMTAAEQEAVYKARMDEEQSVRVRAERNARLAACDWTQLADAPVDSLVWANYRQTLRDVPSLDGFPWTFQWPEKP
jgi:hypothetical protein